MTPEQEDQVRRALASAPPEGPLPPEVAARLDARLAELQSERADARDGVEVTGPTTGRAPRGRQWPRLLVAAAVLTVVGIGLGNVLDDFADGGGAMEAMTADEAGGESGGQPPAAREDAPEEQLAEAENFSAAESPVTERMVATGARVALDSDTLESDVVALLSLRLPRAAADDELHAQSEGATDRARKLRRLFTPCRLPSTDRGDRLVAVRLDGEPATLVLRAPTDGTRVAQVYSCDDPTRLLARTEADPR